jgi:hypothetical protein
MDQMTETRNSTAQKFIYDDISGALARAGLPYDHPIREVLNREAEIIGTREAVVRVRNERGEMLMPDDRIEELRHDPRYASTFPPDPPKVARSDMRKLTENFAGIADGTVRVE